MFGNRAKASCSSNGSSAASNRGQRMLVSFQGSHDIGRDDDEGRVPLRGGKLGRDGGHPIEQCAEENLCVEPSQRRVVARVGQQVEPHTAISTA